MKYKYKNDTQRTIIYRNKIWQPNMELETSYPVPSSLGLTCTQEGDTLDPVLFHDDIIIDAGQERTFEINAPTLSHKIDLTILCMSENSGVECRFNSANNNPIPIDERGFQQVLFWELCSKIILKNPLDTYVHISVTALEVA